MVLSSNIDPNFQSNIFLSHRIALYRCCRFNGTDLGEKTTLGPSFVLYILSFLLAVGSTGIIFFNSKGNMVEPM